MPVVVLILVWPLIEIGLFVIVGGWIGLLATLGVVIGTGVAGVTLLRKLGLGTAKQLRGEMGWIRDPFSAASDGVLRALAAFFLILPGFFTDFLGLLLLVPALRRGLVSVLTRNVGASSMRSDQPARRTDGIVIDGEFVEIDPKDGDEGLRRSVSSSGWTRH